MIYRLRAEAEFEAEDFVDACRKLAIHFDTLRKGIKPEKKLVMNGEIIISRVGNIFLPPGIIKGDK